MIENRLHEKLNALRKHYNYSQADVARFLGVTVNEYMNYENGNNVCGIDLLKKLSTIYHVPLDDLVDNTRPVVLPSLDPTDLSVEIPFLNQQVGIPPLDDLSSLTKEDAADHILPVSGALPPAGHETSRVYQQAIADQPIYEQSVYQESINDTKDMHTREFEATEVHQIIDQHEPYDSFPGDDDSAMQKTPFYKNKKVWIILGCVVACVLTIVLVINQMGLKKNNIALSSINRVALSDQASFFIDDNEHLHIMGDQSISLPDQDVVQVSASNSFATVLKKDGSVVSSDETLNKEISKWRKIAMVASGKDHIVAVDTDGVVHCVGNDVACKIDGTDKVRHVYAGDGISIARKVDGTLVVQGNVNAKKEMEKLTSVANVSIADTQIAVTFNDGGVRLFALGQNRVTNIKDLPKVDQAVAGNDFVAGLKGGRVVCALDQEDEEFSNAVELFRDVKYIAAKNHTLIVVEKDGSILGAGDNKHEVYGYKEDPLESEEPTDEQLEPLPSVANIEFSVTAANVVVKFDEVEDAAYYVVSVNTDPETRIKSARNSASIPADKLTTGETYEVSVVAYPKDRKKYEKSEASVVNYTFSRETLALETVKSPSLTVVQDGWLVSFQPVDFAKGYKITCGDFEKEVSEPKCLIERSYLESGKSYTIEIVALADPEEKKFVDSEPCILKGKYVDQGKILPVVSGASYIPVSNGWKISWNRVDGALSYTVTIGGIEPKMTYDTSVVFEDLSEGTYDITITANPLDSDKMPSVYKTSQTYTPKND